MTMNKSVTANGQQVVGDDVAEQIAALPAITEFLPIRFANGNSVGKFTLRCGCCMRDLEPENIRVDIKQQSGIGMAAEMWGICWECKTLTPGKVRFKDNGTFLTYSEQAGWSERKYGADRRQGSISLAFSILKKLFLGRE